MTTETATARLTPAQVATGAEVLARAFWDDPMTVYIMPDERKRMSASAWFFGVAERYVLRHGEAYTTTGNVEGCALWLPPGETKTSMLGLMRAGMLAGPFRFGLGPLSRLMGLLNKFEQLHERDMPDRHWHLFILGVDPPRQGQGLGSSLIAPVLARADADGLPCYLETTKAKNVVFYKKHGFEVVVEDDTSDGKLHYWTMKRAAR